jgi:alpha-beta hydrolase superfamily lysophospholipase
MQEDMVNRAAQSVRSPITLVFAGGDKLVDPARTKAVAPLFPKGRLRTLEIEGAGHEIFNELPKYRKPAVAEFVRWIEQRGMVG